MTLLAFETVSYRGELVSFALEEAALEAARERISLAATREEEAEMEQQRRGESEASAAAHAVEEAARATQATSDARHAELLDRREAGKQREAARRAAKKR